MLRSMQIDDFAVTKNTMMYATKDRRKLKAVTNYAHDRHGTQERRIMKIFLSRAILMCIDKHTTTKDL